VVNSSELSKLNSLQQSEASRQQHPGLVYIVLSILVVSGNNLSKMTHDVLSEALNFAHPVTDAV